MLPLKREMDRWIADVSNRKEWTVLSENSQSKTYIRYRGFDFSPELPILWDTYRFRNIDDIRLVVAALMDFRYIWDNDKKQVSELHSYRNTNTIVNYILGER